MNLLKIFEKPRLRTKFVFPISLMLVASILVISGYLIQRQAESIRRELETNGETMIRILAMQAESGVLFESSYELDELLAKFSVFDNVEGAMIFNNQGELLAEIGSWRGDSIVRLRDIDFSVDPEGIATENFYVEDMDGLVFIELNHPVITRREKLDRENLGITSGIDQTLGRSYVQEEIGSIKLILSLEAVNASISAARTASYVLTLLVAVLAIVVLTFFIRFVTRPVTMLVEITDQVSRGDYSQRVNITQRDEIGQLANTFNKMIESLKQSRDEIEEYNRTLEEKIIQRTLELEDAQAQLIQSEKMSAIGQLAAGVAHELNNPLGGILGYAQFALEKMKKSTPENTTVKQIASYVRYLTDIETQARRCKAIVQNLLRFSRSSRSAEFSDVDIANIIRDTITFVEHQLHMNQIELDLRADPDLPLIQGNAGQLQQVFTNLIINAMHASPPETSIKVIAKSSPALGEFGGAIELSFIDEGAGISPENLKKIFEPFFTTKDVGKGTGLGLSVSYGIVKDHGGEIKVDSEVGRGSTFTIILPLQKAATETDTNSNEFTSNLTFDQS